MKITRGKHPVMTDEHIAELQNFKTKDLATARYKLRKNEMNSNPNTLMNGCINR
jgi:hypothetical protein